MGRFCLSPSVRDLRCTTTAEEERPPCRTVGVVFSARRCCSTDAPNDCDCRFLEDGPESSCFCSAKERPVFLPLDSDPTSNSRALGLCFFVAGCVAFFGGAVGLLRAEELPFGSTAAARAGADDEDTPALGARNLSITLALSARRVVLSCLSSACQEQAVAESGWGMCEFKNEGVWDFPARTPSACNLRLTSASQTHCQRTPTMAVPARIPGLVLCLAMCGCFSTEDHRAVAFTTAAAFRTPAYCDRRHAATASVGGVGPRQQRTCRRRARPSPAWRRRPSPSAGSLRLSSVESEDEEGDDTAGVYVATEVSKRGSSTAAAPTACA